MTAEPDSGNNRDPAPPDPDSATIPTIPLGTGARPANPDVPSFGRYEIMSELGKGAMGVVYKARDPLLERTVAIKTVNLSMDPGEMAEYEARFYQEAKAAGGLNHPNIVTVYDIGRSGNVAFMAMEFLEGQELRALLAPNRPLPVEQVLSIAAQAAEGLSSAHEHGVVHRDIKPANLMVVRDGLVKIMDFGIARMRSSDVLTQTGVVLGSPKYMSPEQVAGKRADHRSDIFSLGVVVYEMLTGQAPFQGESMTAIMLQTLNFTPDPPSRLNPEVPAVVDFIVAKTLAKKLEDRYQDARELANDLRECLKAPHGQDAPEVSASRSISSLPEGLAQDLAQDSAEAPRSRRSDFEEEPPATRGVSPVFDSLSATLRLAAATGLSGEFDVDATTQKAAPLKEAPATAAQSFQDVDTAPPPARVPPSPSMSRRDKLIFAAALAAALVLAAVIASG
ncbi:MAG TPA: serine/threonine-protein kinase [Burkholderiales bacterium]|nr:serine/threonine-protein kinase [Burkholderiales bacterium]